MSYLIIGLPASYFLSNEKFGDLGVPGIWLGTSLGAFLVSLFSVIILACTNWEGMSDVARKRASRRVGGAVELAAVSRRRSADGAESVRLLNGALVDEESVAEDDHRQNAIRIS